MNKSRKLHVPKDFGTRAKVVLEKVHIDILPPIDPEAVNGHQYANSFAVSISRYQKVYFLKTGDDAIERVPQIFADICKPGTLVCDGAGEFKLKEIKQFCKKARRKTRAFSTFNI